MIFTVYTQMTNPQVMKIWNILVSCKTLLCLFPVCSHSPPPRVITVLIDPWEIIKQIGRGGRLVAWTG